MSDTPAMTLADARKALDAQLREGVRNPHKTGGAPIDQRAAASFMDGQYQVVPGGVDRDGAIAIRFVHNARTDRDGNPVVDYDLVATLCTDGPYTGVWMAEICPCMSNQCRSGETTSETGECRHMRAIWHMLNDTPEYRRICGHIYAKEIEDSLAELLPTDDLHIPKSWSKKRRAEALQSQREREYDATCA